MRRIEKNWEDLRKKSKENEPIFEVHDFLDYRSTWLQGVYNQIKYPLKRNSSRNRVIQS